MVNDFIPPHVVGRDLPVLHDPKETILQEFLDIGGYIRVSTPKEAQVSSIEYQKDLLKQWAEVEKYNLIKVYTDIKSGEYSYFRNELSEMLNDVKDGKIKGVVTKEISRTSRDVMDILELKRKIASYGGFFVSIKESYDSRTDDDEFLLILHAALAQKERKQTAGRVKLTQMMKAKEGKVNCANPAYGYMLNKDGQYYVKNPETYPIFRFIIEKFLAGWGQAKLARHLNSKGVPGPRGKKWHSNSIRTIVNNPVYLGIVMYNVTTAIRDANGKRKLVVRPQEEWIVREDAHEPLITQEEWDRLQQTIQYRKKKYAHEWVGKKKYLGSSILRCAECGGKVYGTKFSKRKRGVNSDGYYYRYGCPNRNGNCSRPMKIWHMDKVDALIAGLAKKVFANKEKLIFSVKKQLNVCDQENKEAVSKREEIQKQIEKIDKAIKKQQMAFEVDVINLQEYKDRMAELRSEKQSLTDKLVQINNQLIKTDSVVDRVKKIFDNVKNKIECLEDLSYEDRSDIIFSIFDSIYLTADYRITDFTFRFF